MLYTCKYYSGSGKEYDGGIWELKETPKVLLLKQTQESFFNPNYTCIRIQKFYTRDSNQTKKGQIACIKEYESIKWANNGNVLIDWKDKTFTAYPGQCGTPYYFEPLGNS